MNQCRTCVYAQMQQGRVDCHGEPPKVIVLPVPQQARGLGKQSRVLGAPKETLDEMPVAPMSIRGTVFLNDQACPRYLNYGADSGLTAEERGEQAKWREPPPPQAQNASSKIEAS